MYLQKITQNLRKILKNYIQFIKKQLNEIIKTSIKLWNKENSITGWPGYS